ncbi:hypothetical protein EJ110_NYTH05384 [Nymphaea thermarum]|nr:hypothetical protein EJ110_NYTH05384 [Nymphaea thermarum]
METYATQRPAWLVPKKSMKKRAWTRDEDDRLSQCVKFHGEARWRLVPAEAVLISYLNSIFVVDITCTCGGYRTQPLSEELQVEMVELLEAKHQARKYYRGGGRFDHQTSQAPRQQVVLLFACYRWALIAGRLPGRTDNEIKNYWKTHLSKKIKPQQPQQKKAVFLCKPDAVDEKKGLTEISGAGGSNCELTVEPTITGEGGVSSNAFNIEEIRSVGDTTTDCCFWNSRAEGGSTECGCIKQGTPSNEDGMYRFDYSSLNDYDISMEMNLDSDIDFQSFIRSMCCEEA